MVVKVKPRKNKRHRVKFRKWRWDLGDIDLQLDKSKIVRRICERAAQVVIDQMCRDLGDSALEYADDGSWVVHFSILQDDDLLDGVESDLPLTELFNDAIWLHDEKPLEQLRAELLQIIEKLDDRLSRTPLGRLKSVPHSQ